MSSEAISWAIDLTLGSSSLKLTLIALCHCAHHKTGRIMPSVAHLCATTELNRKTVIANVRELEERGLIHDTGERVGVTKSVKVYGVGPAVPKTEPLEVAKAIPEVEPLEVVEAVPEVEQLPGGEVVPFPAQLPEGSSTVFTRKQSQKRDSEPSREPSRDKVSVEADASTAADAAIDEPELDVVVEADPPPQPMAAIDVVKVIFDTGTALLTATGVPERKARSVIGRWRKQFGDSVVLVSLSRCQVEGPSEPIEWMTKALQSEQGKAGGNGHDRTQDLFGGASPRHGAGVFKAVERGFDLLADQLPDKGRA